MKTIYKTITLRLPSMMKANHLLTSACLSGALLLTGCQTTTVSQPNTAAKPLPSTAKKTLANALQKQRRHMAVADYVDQHCEEAHDQAYAALILEAEKQNKEVLATD